MINIMSRLSTAQRVQVLSALVEGDSVRSTSWFMQRSLRGWRGFSLKCRLLVHPSKGTRRPTKAPWASAEPRRIISCREMGSAVKIVKCVAVLFVLLVGFLAIGFFASDDKKPTVAAKTEAVKKEDVKQEEAPEKLDVSKPTFTKEYAAICPSELLYDKREDRSPRAIFDAIVSIWNRSSKLKELGCEEWQGGIRVYPNPMGLDKDGGVVLMSSAPDGGIGLFTFSSQLTNHGPVEDANPVPAHTQATEVAPVAPATVPVPPAAPINATTAPDPQAVPISTPPAPDPAQAPVNPPASSQE
jgi:hypothetical protein